MADREFRAVKVERGSQGWGGPLIIEPTAEKDKIVAVIGGGIPAVAQKIADLTGAEVVDGFRRPPAESEIAAVVVDCGGTARAGVYPRKRIPTINLTPVGQAGPLAEFITEDIYVSGVREGNVELAEGSEGAAAGAGSSATVAPGGDGAETAAQQDPFSQSGGTQPENGGGFTGAIANIGRAMGGVVGVLFQSGRQAID